MADNPSDKQSLITRALMIIGHGPIGLDDETEFSQTASNMFDMTVDLVFGLHSWRFAQRLYALTQITTPTPALRSYAFSYPGGQLEPPLSIYHSLTREGRDTHCVLQESVVYSDHAALWGVFRTVPSIAVWPGAFKVAFTKALACELCIPIAELMALDDKLRSELYGRDWEQYQGGLFGRLVAQDKMAQPRALPMLGDQLNEARKS